MHLILDFQDVSSKYINFLNHLSQTCLTKFLLQKLQICQVINVHVQFKWAKQVNELTGRSPYRVNYMPTRLSIMGLQALCKSSCWYQCFLQLALYLCQGRYKGRAEEGLRSGWVGFTKTSQVSQCTLNRCKHVGYTDFILIAHLHKKIT